MFLQVLTNGLISSAQYTLIGLGFGLIYSVTRFFNLAHGIIITIGAYFIFYYYHWLNLPFMASLLTASISTTLIGCLIDRTIYYPLRRKEASPTVFLLTSLGIYIVFQNIISIIFGDDAKRLSYTTVRSGIDIFGVKVTPVQLSTLATALFLFIAITFWLKKAKFGIALRSVANNRELARIVGIHLEKVIIYAFAIGSFLAAIAGILISLDIDMVPTMGLNALMMGLIAVIVGGINRMSGIVLGALLLGLSQHAGAWLFGSQWQDLIAFALLAVFILFKPQGFLGIKSRKVRV